MGKDAVDHLFDVIERDDPDSEDVDIVLRVHVQPGAGRSALVGRYGDAVKLRVAAPPEGGRANLAVIELLANTLGVPPAQVKVVSGEHSRTKRVRIGPVDLEAVRRLLGAAEEVAAGGAGRQGNVRGGGTVR